MDDLQKHIAVGQKSLKALREYRDYYTNVLLPSEGAQELDGDLNFVGALQNINNAFLNGEYRQESNPGLYECLAAIQKNLEAQTSNSEEIERFKYFVLETTQAEVHELTAPLDKRVAEIYLKHAQPDLQANMPTWSEDIIFGHNIYMDYGSFSVTTSLPNLKEIIDRHGGAENLGLDPSEVQKAIKAAAAVELANVEKFYHEQGAKEPDEQWTARNFKNLTRKIDALLPYVGGYDGVPKEYQYIINPKAIEGLRQVAIHTEYNNAANTYYYWAGQGYYGDDWEKNEGRWDEEKINDFEAHTEFAMAFAGQTYETIPDEFKEVLNPGLIKYLRDELANLDPRIVKLKNRIERYEGLAPKDKFYRSTMIGRVYADFTDVEEEDTDSLPKIGRDPGIRDQIKELEEAGFPVAKLDRYIHSIADRVEALDARAINSGYELPAGVPIPTLDEFVEIEKRVQAAAQHAEKLAGPGNDNQHKGGSRTAKNPKQRKAHDPQPSFGLEL